MKFKRLIVVAAVSLSALVPALSSAQSIVNPHITALTVWSVGLIGIIGSQKGPTGST